MPGVGDTGLQLRSLIKASGELEISLVDVPTPEPRSDEVVVRIEATPINPSDIGLLVGAADLATLAVRGSGEATVATARIPDAAPRVRKGANGEDGYSGFTMRDPLSGETIPTELEPILRGAGVDRVVVVGLATDYCVKATALDARRLGFETAVLADAIAAVERAPGDGAGALDEMREAGVAIWQAVMR